MLASAVRQCKSAAIKHTAPPSWASHCCRPSQSARLGWETRIYIRVCVSVYVIGQPMSDFVAHQAPLLCPWHFSRQKYWSGLPFPSPGDLPDPGIETAFLTSPLLAGRFLTTSATWGAPYEISALVRRGGDQGPVCLCCVRYSKQTATQARKNPHQKRNWLARWSWTQDGEK